MTPRDRAPEPGGGASPSGGGRGPDTSRDEHEHEHAGHDHEHAGHDHDHAGHDHDHGGHDHAATAASARPFDVSRYEGVEGHVVRRVSDCERELLAVVPREQFDRIVDDTARALARRVTLKGFRPGKVPLARIKQMHAKDIRQRAFETLIQDTWRDAQAAQELRPVANPQLVEASIEDGQPVRFAARFEVLPELELAGLDAISVTPKQVQVTDREVEDEIESLRAMRAELVPSGSDEAHPGDFAVVDLERWAPGASRDEPPAERGDQLVVEVGNEKNLPELDKALLGMTIGETRSFDAKVPAGGEAGTEGTTPATAPFRVKLTAVNRRRLPELDDAFVRTLGDFEGVAALREEVRRRIVEGKTDAARREQEAEALEKLIQQNPFTLPPSLVEAEAEARLRRGVEQLARRGVDVEKASIDWKGEFDKAREVAERDLRADYLLELVARARGIEVGEADVEVEIRRLAEARRVSPLGLRAELEKAKQISNLKAGLRRRRTLDLLRSGASISVA